MKSSIFWDITLCSTVKINRCFVKTYHLHHQWQRVSQARNQHEWGKQRSVPLKRRLTFNGLHDGISLKIESFFPKRNSQLQFSAYSYAVDFGLQPDAFHKRAVMSKDLYCISDKTREDMCQITPTARGRHTERMKVPASRFCRSTLMEWDPLVRPAWKWWWTKWSSVSASSWNQIPVFQPVARHSNGKS
jgi:hypothetical protein